MGFILSSLVLAKPGGTRYACYSRPPVAEWDLALHSQLTVVSCSRLPGWDPTGWARHLDRDQGCSSYACGLMRRSEITVCTEKK